MSILNDIVDVDEAAQMWGLSPYYVKKLCKLGKIESKQIRSTWVILKNQRHPKKPSKMFIRVEKRRNNKLVPGEEWIREFTNSMELDFINKIDLEYRDKDIIKKIKERIEGEYLLDNGCFTYHVTIFNRLKSKNVEN